MLRNFLRVSFVGVTNKSGGWGVGGGLRNSVLLIFSIFAQVLN